LAVTIRELELIGGAERTKVVPVPFAVNCCAEIARSSGANEFAVIVASAGTFTTL